MTTDPLSAWGYVRLSQRGREGSLDEQKKAIREYARRNERIELVTTLNEGDLTSGFNAERPKYQQLLNHIQDTTAEAVVVRDRARLSRDFDERLRLVTLFRNTGTELHVVEDGGEIDLEDPLKAGTEAIHAATDHIKKKIEIDRTKEAVKKRMEEGYDHGPPRVGMEYRDDGKYQQPGEDYDLVKRVWELHDQGESYYRIEKETGVAKSTAQRIVENKDWYLKREAMAENV